MSTGTSRDGRFDPRAANGLGAGANLPSMLVSAHKLELSPLDAPRGFEPRLTESESVVLPLDDGATPVRREGARYERSRGVSTREGTVRPRKKRAVTSSATAQGRIAGGRYSLIIKLRSVWGVPICG